MKRKGISLYFDKCVERYKLRAYVLAFGSIVAKTRKKKPVTCFVSRVVFYGALTSLVYSDCIVADKFQSSTVPILTFSNENRGTKADSFHLIPDMIKKMFVSPLLIASPVNLQSEQYQLNFFQTQIRTFEFFITP